MPSKHEISILIRKRRKATLYGVINSLAGYAAAYPDYPHRNYAYMPPKWIPPHVYRAWWLYTTHIGRYVTYTCEPRDFLWLMDALVE